MKKAIYLIFLVSVIASCSNDTKVENKEQITIEGVDLPKTLINGESELILNGAGVRSKLFIKVYVGGLYLPEETNDSDEIINADVPSIIRMVAVTRAFTSKIMSKTVREKFEESAEGNIEPYKTRIDLLCGMLDTASFQKGDVCDLMYTPNEGIRVYRNGADLNVLVSGLDFKQVFYKNWLSKTLPADESLRQGMLGLK